MTKRDAVVLVSRALMLYLIVWVLTEITYLPEKLFALAHYIRYASAAPANNTYYHYYRGVDLINLVFLVIRIVGVSCLARWLFKAGPGVEELLIPPRQEPLSASQS
jgi:hypothetical protein